MNESSFYYLGGRKVCKYSVLYEHILEVGFLGILVGLVYFGEK